MSSLSGGTKDIYSSYIKLILYQSQFCENSLNIKQISPYGLSIQFDNNPESFIEPLKNLNETFNSSQSTFKYFINNNNQKHLIKINCFSKSIFIIKKKIASVKIAINPNIIKTDKEKKIKKWYYVKNNNREVILKLLISIDILNIKNLSNSSGNDSNKIYLLNENELDNNISINKPNNINIHFNSISNNNLNGLQNSTYMSTSHYISSSNNSLKSSSTKTNISNLSNPMINSINNQNNKINNRTISNNNINNNLLSSIIEKDDSMTIYENDTNSDKFGELISNNLLISLQNLIKKNNQKLFLKSKNLIQKKQQLGKEENNYFKSKKNYEEKNSKLKNNIKILDTKRQIYENKFIDLTENYNKYEKDFYKAEIKKDLNMFENEILGNINNIYINQNNLEEIILEQKMTKNYFGQYSMTKNLKENEKSVINNYYNSKGYSFESNNFKNSLYLYGNGGNSYKILLNIMFDNKSINNNNFFNMKPSPISYKFKEINKELSVSMSNSNSPCSEKENQKKKRLITDYSKSTLNILDDLYIFDELPDVTRNKGSKSNNIVQNNLALNIDDISNDNNTFEAKNKFRKDKKNKVFQNNTNNKKNTNMVNKRKKIKKITINDENNNSYYRLEDKYYTITTVNKTSKHKEINFFNKKIIPKKIENNHIPKKDIDVKKSYEKIFNTNGVGTTTINKTSYKSIIFKSKLDSNSIIKNENNINKNKINDKNILPTSTKNEKNNKNIFLENINTKKNNRVFKNIFTTNKKKEKQKREKMNSKLTENTDEKSINSSVSGFNSILPDKFNTIDNNSRNIKNHYNTNSNKNIKFKKINRNCIQIDKKNELINEKEKENLIHHFCYNNETIANTNTKNLNNKISLYINNMEPNKSTIDSGCFSKIVTKKITNNKINNTVYYNLIHKKATNNKIKTKNNSKNKNNNKLIQNKINYAKKIINDNKISFYYKKNKTLCEGESKNNITKNGNKALINNKNTNEYNTNTYKNKNNKIIKNNNNHYCCLINNSHLKPLGNNDNKNSVVSIFNNRYN